MTPTALSAHTSIIPFNVCIKEHSYGTNNEHRNSTLSHTVCNFIFHFIWGRGHEYIENNDWPGHKMVPWMSCWENMVKQTHFTSKTWIPDLMKVFWYSCLLVQMTAPVCAIYSNSKNKHCISTHPTIWNTRGSWLGLLSSPYRFCNSTMESTEI